MIPWSSTDLYCTQQIMMSWSNYTLQLNLQGPLLEKQKKFCAALIILDHLSAYGGLATIYFTKAMLQNLSWHLYLSRKISKLHGVPEITTKE